MELAYYEALPLDLTQIVEDSNNGRQPYMWYKIRLFLTQLALYILSHLMVMVKLAHL
ncbi:hypothetical protein [Arsenophonus endosymbiont of Aleurodicus floccissimus]|uniref:hypothetical protein n=1 Tax=Arsenophonus endosymbiont of Aleurodicus floccissimus TaxID=2152761 RepID=UPI00160419EC|nr:hypothetical protein [Arsenophonus endosymbiont of Aleurodicus floccissimus]